MPCAPGLSSNHEPVSAGFGSPEMLFSSSAASHAGSRPVRGGYDGMAKAVRSARRRRLPTLCFDALMPARLSEVFGAAEEAREGRGRRSLGVGISSVRIGFRSEGKHPKRAVLGFPDQQKHFPDRPI